MMKARLSSRPARAGPCPKICLAATVATSPSQAATVMKAAARPSASDPSPAMRGTTGIGLRCRSAPH